MTAFFPSQRTKERRKMAEQAKNPQPQGNQPTNKTGNGTTPKEVKQSLQEEELTEAQLEALCDPTKRYIVIDTHNFTHMIVGIMQLSSRELRQILIRRDKEDHATLEKPLT